MLPPSTLALSALQYVPLAFLLLAGPCIAGIQKFPIKKQANRSDSRLVRASHIAFQAPNKPARFTVPHTYNNPAQTLLLFRPPFEASRPSAWVEPAERQADGTSKMQRTGCIFSGQELPLFSLGLRLQKEVCLVRDSQVQLTSCGFASVAAPLRVLPRNPNLDYDHKAR